MSKESVVAGTVLLWRVKQMRLRQNGKWFGEELK
jgi:hypothetical protein